MVKDTRVPSHTLTCPWGWHSRENAQFLLQLQNSTGQLLVNTKHRRFVVGLCVTIDSVVYLMEQLLAGW